MTGPTRRAIQPSQVSFASVLAVGLASSYARRPALRGQDASAGSITPPPDLRQLSCEQYAGGWALAWTVRGAGGQVESGTAQLLFSWEESRFRKSGDRSSVVLGRGDVLVLWFPEGKPPVAECGTMRCFHDPGDGVWRSSWISSARGCIYSMTEQRIDGDIVMEGSDLHGRPLRWVFSQLAPEAFHWRSLAAAQDGTEWHILEEFTAHRVSANTRRV